ncbi:MAG: hypothetical protein L0H86_09935, partial [Micrococcaceae bacterium]|nr:hypothetical protein [Micrococcaceae bacterium]
VLLDAFVVRMTITPAIMHLLGRRAWYIPKWLDRILPDVDVEGAKIAALAAPESTGPDGATGASDTGENDPDGSGPPAGGPRHPAHRADGPHDALR